MTPIQQQFELLRCQYPDAVLFDLPDRSHLVTVPGVSLPCGWSKPTTTVKFIAPVGFPLARPDCFWADHDLRLTSGVNPQNSAVNAIPHVGTAGLWFSWHLQSWNPNSDNLLTYLNVTKRRLQATS